MKKAIAAILIAIFAVSAFSLVATASARPFMNWNFKQIGPNSMGMGGGKGSFVLPSQQSFVRV
ncbi:MAG TPA: hypothetical protein VLV84_01810, partial [Candidatus Acidoferrales bacterium]|nr:hypothetical protein [Candidatus Acidoferrales bacterium]